MDTSNKTLKLFVYEHYLLYMSESTSGEQYF